jgi:GNAT superfamily N-acetyltransferase
VTNPESEINQSSITTSIASSGTFKIELIKKIGNSDKKDLIEISKSLAAEYGSRSLLTEKTIDIYFNREGTLPLIARSQKNIIGYIIGLPIESLSKEPWARLDENYEKYNTIYTYAFVIKDEYKGNGYAKMLKKVYLNWAKKREGITFITGHVRSGITSRFKGEIKVINQVENWQGTGKVFEYYRRNLDPEKIHSS